MPRCISTLAIIWGGVVLAACSFQHGALSSDSGVGDGDGAPGCPCALGCEMDGTSCLAFDPSNLDDFALLADAGSALVIPSGVWTLDTTTGVLLDSLGMPVADQRVTAVDDGASPIEVWALDALEIAAGATLRVRGERALLVLAGTTITIAGTLDVSAGCDDTASAVDRDRLWCGGPGGGDGGHRDNGNGRTEATGCAPGGAGNAGSNSDENGGGGGGFGTAGANGGGFDGNGGDSEGGSACGVAELEPLFGGSGGGTAGYRASSGDDNRTAGGGGGGAVQLTARISIEVTGVIDASGEGGAGTAQASTYTPPGTDGGGGGGAGGGILLEAPAVMLGESAILAANGGGGGAGITIDRRGQRGQRARTRAAGGVNDNGTGGGAGAYGDGTDEIATAGDAPGDGGSGGGGGAGRIHIHAVSSTVPPAAIVSPSSTTANLIAL